MLSDFLYLCTALSHSCTLTIPLPNDSFLLQTDASKKGISGILSVLRDEMELPVAFFSLFLTSAGGEGEIICCYRAGMFSSEGKCLSFRSVFTWETIYCTNRSLGFTESVKINKAKC